jgi:cytoskeletal protein CcmA (bactofilin family)
MLPNFRRSESESAKSASPAPSLGEHQPTPAFPARTVLAIPRTNSDRPVSVIGADLTINGNLISKGEVQVEGTVQGDVAGSHVVIGEQATITGNVLAEEVVVRGHVIGAVHSKRVMLQSTSQIEGDIYHQSLSIEQGAMFEGKSRRTADDPRALVEASPAPTPLLPLPPELPNFAN